MKLSSIILMLLWGLCWGLTAFLLNSWLFDDPGKVIIFYFLLMGSSLVFGSYLAQREDDY